MHQRWLGVVGLVVGIDVRCCVLFGGRGCVSWFWIVGLLLFVSFGFVWFRFVSLPLFCLCVFGVVVVGCVFDS